MTTKELTKIVTKNGVTLAEINHALAQLTRMSITQHGVHQIARSRRRRPARKRPQTRRRIVNLEKQWQAYLTRQPQN